MRDKIGVVERFLELADVLCIGGAMCFPFLAAQGHRVGASLWREDDVASARRAHGRRRLELPIDLSLAPDEQEEPASRDLDGIEVPDGWSGLDIGPRTSARYGAEIAAAGTVFWNGPMGRFELEPGQERSHLTPA